jgi:hypothetical protein
LTSDTASKQNEFLDETPRRERSHELRLLSSAVKILPEELYSAYDQYKKDTKTVTTWLATRSRQCGYQLEEFSEEINESAEGTKGRKQVGHYKLVYNASGSTTSKKIIIPVRLFGPMAHHIISYNNPPIEIPKSFSHVVQRTVSARTVCNMYFQRRGEGQKGENDKHVHFIGVLKNAVKVLGPIEKVKHFPQWPTEPWDTTYSIASVAEANIHTRFASLHVEYISEVYLNIPDVSPAAQLVATTEYEVKDMKDDE